MSNIKKVLISGKIPFNCNEHDRMLRWLGVMNTPAFGLRITWGNGVMIPNEHGGKTATYDFSIEGEEAIAFSAYEDLLVAIVETGGVVLKQSCIDIENL